ncbi:hypothetical protein HanPI659440_Chr15g0592341 [Helianthus annuus]|nr:hypothetical protein HanPI659440_Chr15g0592341 [Helianthus annuus]
MVVESIRKLTIWHTPTFHPIINHDELDHILSTLGFLPLPPAPTATTADAPVWKEYSFPAARLFLKGSSSPPRPRLPYPRIDGLHVNTYRSFLESVDVYLCMDNISDLFHIRYVFFFSRFVFLLRIGTLTLAGQSYVV